MYKALQLLAKDNVQLLVSIIKNVHLLLKFNSKILYLNTVGFYHCPSKMQSLESGN